MKSLITSLSKTYPCEPAPNPYHIKGKGIYVVDRLVISLAIAFRVASIEVS
ncbi:MAG: hypothetical protein HC930_17010 [Hydrococcus sp. SU_1_0]|nr:hypothetical protein [Hydrococcus sp. SU_1_0]